MVWANMVHGQGWWKTEKLRLEVNKLQLEIALLESDAAAKGLERSAPQTRLRQPSTTEVWAMDGQFARQMLAAWLGAMTVLAFLMAIDLLLKLAKGGSLHDLDLTRWLLSSLPYLLLLSLPVPFAASNKRGGTLMEAMRQGLSSAITIFIGAMFLLGSMNSVSPRKDDSKIIPTPSTQPREAS